MKFISEYTNMEIDVVFWVIVCDNVYIESKRELMKGCISKTNEQVFGALARFLIGATTTSKGQRSTLFVAVVMCLLGVELGLTVLAIETIVDFRMGVGQLFPLFGVAITGAVVMFFTIVYAVTLYDNCTSENEESE